MAEIWAIFSGESSEEMNGLVTPCGSLLVLSPGKLWPGILNGNEREVVHKHMETFTTSRDQVHRQEFVSARDGCTGQEPISETVYGLCSWGVKGKLLKWALAPKWQDKQEQDKWGVVHSLRVWMSQSYRYIVVSVAYNVNLTILLVSTLQYGCKNGGKFVLWPTLLINLMFLFQCLCWYICQL